MPYFQFYVTDICNVLIVRLQIAKPTALTMRFFPILFILTLIAIHVNAQTCTAPGQNPGTAFPVCGTSTFTQTTVPLCGGRALPYKGCGSNNVLEDVNPFWYKFTCFKSGTLGFLITPKDLSDDYDWELYDITGRNPEDIYTDGNLVVSNNWSGESGLTGASAQGSQVFVCYGYGRPLFSKMPTLIEGHNYLLLISHFTNTQSGYSLSFAGGTAVITDAGTPALKVVEAHCSGSKVGVKISKKIKCSSIATNGSDFYLMPGNIPVTAASGFGCNNGFDTDSLELTLPSALAPGKYTLHIKKGSDNNTLLDYCDNAIPDNDQLSFTINARVPVQMDSLKKLTCAPNQLQVYFSKPVLCSSIAPDGSDFFVNGNYGVTITGVTTQCNAATTRSVILQLAAPMQKEGSFNLLLRNGSDGNTVLDECTEEALAGAALPFAVKDTVSANFTYTIQYGCAQDVISFSHNTGNGVNSWKWNLDDGKVSNQQNPVATYTLFEEKEITLVASNGFCSDTSTSRIVLDNYLKADIAISEDHCPNEPVLFKGEAQGKVVSHLWDFGDGNTSDEEAPEHIYKVTRETAFPIKYTITDQWGCQNTAQKTITVYASCLLSIPTAFTPNNDGLNDRLQPLNAVKADDLVFTVYNRWGQKLFQTKNWRMGWNGKMGSQDQPTGVYIWTLRYINRDTKKVTEQKGTVTLIR